MESPVGSGRSSADRPLELLVATPADWAESLLGCAPQLLIDQAHLEKKAAATAVNFLFRIPLDPRWQRGLSVLAREELVHFERTLKQMARRGVAFEAQRASDYAAGLKKGCGGIMPERLIDELLVGAIIEARSCERMRLLAGAFGGCDPDLASFYADLVEAEERHQVLYVDIARSLAAPAEVEARWHRMVAHEAEVLAALPWSERLHGGVPNPYR